ncbi:hypothetical protein AM233_04595 [Bacillus sp. FJAT-22058]|nr:hypothetical protein AM233_04595 [Bacillus sp. FJAT-22058]
MGLKQNEKSIMDAYKRNGSRTGLDGVTVSLRNKSGMIETFDDVEIVFAPSPPKNSWIEINVQEKDKERFKAYGFKWKYFTDEKVTIKFTDYSDRQIKKGIMDIKPQGSEFTIFFDVKTKI